MNELTAQEENLLQKLRDQPELTGLFFRKAKKLKWFNRLREEGYFDPQSLSGPVSVDDQDGRVRIPAWLPIDYLCNTVKEASKGGNEEFASAYLSIIEDVTNYAKEQELENYQVWWRFASMLASLPTNLIEAKHVRLAEYWLNDRFDRSLVARELGRKWLPKLLDAGDGHSLFIAQEVLAVLLRIHCEKDSMRNFEKDACNFFFDSYHAGEFIRESMFQCGVMLGKNALAIIDKSLKYVLSELGNDKWSAVWQPAIEVHDQNRHREDAENLLVLAYREVLSGHIHNVQADASEFLDGMLNSGFDTLVRIAINAIRENKQHFSPLQDKLISNRFITTNLRHEFWHFLHEVYPTLQLEQKNSVLSLIASITDDDGEHTEGSVAYEQATWLAAIRNFGEVETSAYEKAVKLAGTEPEHPDFSYYMTTGWGGGESPYSVAELQSFYPDELVGRLAGFQPTGGWKEPTIYGLSKAFKERIKSKPLDIYTNLKKFIGIDLAYIYVLIEAFSELWSDKNPLPWEDVWPQLLEFVEQLLNHKEFWGDQYSEQRKEFVANRHWVIGAIGRLVEAGSKSDDHAFPEKTHPAARRVLETILENQTGEDFALESDAVSIAINSPRGRCLQALINLALRECRLADKEQDNHTTVWNGYEGLFNSELERVANKEYEFVTLVTNYLPNFLYLSGEWLHGNLNQIFDQTDELGWSCAMQGYSYIGTVYKEIYEYLRDHGDLLKALDHEHLTSRVEDRFIQQISVAYLNDFEMFDSDNSLIKVVIERFIPEELHHLIWFLWTLRGKKDAQYGPKVLYLRTKIQEKLDLTRKEDRKLASDLCLWIEYVDELNDENMQWLREIVPFADDSHHASEVLECLARLSNEQPFMASELWRSLLERSLNDYPEDAIRTILKNLLLQGSDGVRVAKETVSIYARSYNERPWEWMKELQALLTQQ